MISIYTVSNFSVSLDKLVKMQAAIALSLCAFIASVYSYRFIDNLKWGTVYIKGVNGRIQTGTYRHPWNIVVTLNVGLIKEGDSLTVGNGWKRVAEVREIKFTPKIVTLFLDAPFDYSWLLTPRAAIPFGPVLPDNNCFMIAGWTGNNTFISFLLPAIHEENKVHVRVPNDWEMRNYSTDEFPYEMTKGDLLIQEYKLSGFLSRIDYDGDYKTAIFEPISSVFKK